MDDSSLNVKKSLLLTTKWAVIFDETQVDNDFRNEDEVSGKAMGPEVACKEALRKIDGLEAALGGVSYVSHALNDAFSRKQSIPKD